MMKVRTILQAEGGEQETRSCRGLLRLASGRCAWRTPPYAPERTFSPSWMMRTSHARLSESSQLSVPFAAHWRNHRAACPVAGVLRAVHLWNGPAARICREGEPRVATNVFSRDMNVDVPLAGSRRIEVLANGLPLWQGAQVAVDTTFVSPVSRDGSARASAVSGRGRRRVQSCWRLIAAGWSCWVVVLAPSWRISSAEWLPQRRAQRSSNCHWIWRTSAMARNRPWWRTRATFSTCRPAACPPAHDMATNCGATLVDIPSCRRKGPTGKKKPKTVAKLASTRLPRL